MNEETYIQLNDLHSNPYQPRKGEDLAAVIELAENIERNATLHFDGLLQVPTVRNRKAGGYELAFGHTRLAAFKVLFEQGKERYGLMRCVVRELSDLQMFELAVSENIKRRDLNPIEQAEALDTYMTTFKKTSVEAAEFFGIAASTIRGSVRLLNLPEEAKEKVRSGEIRTTEARALMVVDKLIGEEGVKNVLERMQEEREGPIEAINEIMRFQAGAVRLDSDDDWVKADPFPMKHWMSVKKKDIETLVFEKIEDEDQADGESLAQLVSVVLGGMVVTDEAFPEFSPDALEKIRILANPPACETCPLHAVLDGDHYCGFKLCSTRKAEAWKVQEAEDLSAELGIPFYEKSDGKFEQLTAYNDSDKKLFTARHADLRLIPSQNMFNNFDGVGRNLKVVAVGALAEKIAKKQEKKMEKVETATKEKQEDWELKRRLNHVSSEYIQRFEWEVAARIFASALDGVVNLNLLLCLNEEFSADLPEGVDEDKLISEIKKARKPDGLKSARRLVMMGMLDRHGMSYGFDEKKVIVKYAEKSASLAKDWGVKLPKDWDAQVEKYQAEVESARKDVIEKRKAESA